MQVSADVPGEWRSDGRGLGAGVQGESGGHSCGVTAVDFDVGGCVFSVIGCGSAAGKSREAVLVGVSMVALSSCAVVMTSSPSCDSWGSGSHWILRGVSGLA